MQSKEFQERPEIFTASVISKAKSMIDKAPILFELASQYDILDFITPSFLIKSPDQNYALINYLRAKNISLVNGEKLHPFFGMAPRVLLNKYGIDLKELMAEYPFDGIKRKGKAFI